MQPVSDVRETRARGAPPLGLKPCVLRLGRCHRVALEGLQVATAPYYWAPRALDLEHHVLLLARRLPLLLLFVEAPQALRLRGRF